MVLRALLVSADENASGILNSILSEFGVTTQCCGYPLQSFSLQEYNVDTVLVDFDNPQKAVSIVHSIRSLSNSPVIVAILGDSSALRNVLNTGANFVLYKPVEENAARATLTAAIALVKRERRRSFRVPVQVPVQLQVHDGEEKEGILLDLSEEGLDVLMAEPAAPSAKIRARFALPDGSDRLELCGEVAWANPNGQSGIRISEIPAELHDVLAAFVGKHLPELPAIDPWQDSECRLTDLSLSACYVETASPFPEGSLVELSLKADDVEVSAEGMVQVMHPGLGMGIEFGSGARQRAEVQSILALLTSSPETLPKLSIAPRALVAPRGFMSQKSVALKDPLVQLLRNHEGLSQEAFLEELRQQRSRQEVVIA